MVKIYIWIHILASYNVVDVDRKFNCTDLVQGVVEGLILPYQIRSFRGFGWITRLYRYRWSISLALAEKWIGRNSK